MSTLIVKVQKIDHIEKHPNADTLSILQIGGWNVIAKTEGVEGQEYVVYVPIDSVAKADHPLLSFLEGKRVKTIKLRKIISQGLCLPLKEVESYLVSKGIDPDVLDPNKDLNLQELLEIEKYVPPADPANFGGEAEAGHPDFYKYTDIEHFGNYNKALEGQKVWVSEKLHGTSARYGLTDGQFLIGSRNRQYKHPPTEGHRTSVYSQVFERENLGNKLLSLRTEFPESKVISIYGEIVGPGVQGKVFRYGQEVPTFFLYDIQIDGKYLDYSEFVRLSTKFELRTVPILTENIDVCNVKEAVSIDGQSTLDNHIREGIVIKPMKEMFSPRLGRAVLKIVSKEYLLKDMEDFKNE